MRVSVRMVIEGSTVHGSVNPENVTGHRVALAEESPAKTVLMIRGGADVHIVEDVTYWESATNTPANDGLMDLRG